jgi:type VI secretion system FHA domain protein
MILTLEVCPPQAATLGDGSRHVFSSQGGTIGRGASCSWVLSHRKVSGRHATISYQDSVFYIVDEQSANGVFLNSTKNRLVPGRRYALKNGDRIIIDPYEMEVTISSDRDSARRPSDSSSDARGSWMSAYNPFDEGDPFAPPPPRTPGPLAAPTPKPHQAGEVVPLEELDPLKLLEGSPASKTPVRQGPSARDLDAAPPMSGHYKPPAVLTPPPVAPPPAAVPPSSPAFIPADYDPLRDDFDEPLVAPPPAPTPKPSVVPEPPVARAPIAPAPPPLPTPPPRPANPSAQPADEGPPESVDAPASPVRKTPRPEAAPDQADPGLLAVLAGAGLERAPVTVEFARSFGQIFRVVVTGVMDVLRARQHIKDEFRMKMTQFRPADNNPLKFSANVDDALHNLLVKRNAAYLEPVEAFEDAFDDLRDHQMAMLAGMRVAFEAMLGEFNPDALQKEFDRQVKRSSLLGVTARMRYWDLYRERQEAMAKDPEATFRRLFGEEFARAYDEQLKRLKAERRARAAGPRPSDA